MLGELRNVDPAMVEIGMPVRAMYIDFPEVIAVRRGRCTRGSPTHERARNRGGDDAAGAVALR